MYSEAKATGTTVNYLTFDPAHLGISYVIIYLMMTKRAHRECFKQSSPCDHALRIIW
jgi:hypothetical protein